MAPPPSRRTPRHGGPERPANGHTAAELIASAERAILDSTAIDHWEPGAGRSDAAHLLATVLTMESEDIDPNAVVAAAGRRRYERLVQRRVAGEPVALIVGHIDFRGLRLHTRRGVFLPRGSSEFHAGEVIRRMRRVRRQGGGVCVDVATGAGPLALSVASEVPDAEVWGLDIDAAATALCRANARRLGLANAHCATGDMLAPLPMRLHGGVDVVAMHPPYVAAHEVEGLPDEVRRFEPTHALTDHSGDGLEMVRRLADEAPGWLARHGRVSVEIGPGLSRSAQAIFRRAGYHEVRWLRDGPGITRVIIAQR